MDDTVAGRYRLERRLHSGDSGYSRWLGTDTALRRTVEVDLLPLTAEVEQDAVPPRDANGHGTSGRDADSVGARVRPGGATAADVVAARGVAQGGQEPVGAADPAVVERAGDSTGADTAVADGPLAETAVVEVAPSAATGDLPGAANGHDARTRDVDPAALEHRFWDAAASAAGLHHPNITPVHDAGRDDNRLYLVSEAADGETLDVLVGAPAALATATAIGIQVCRALQAAHADGLPHLRLDPSAVVLSGDGSVRVRGFGLAPALPAPDNLADAAYRAPEQTTGRPGTAASDLYAVGCLLYALATGAPPDGPGAPRALRTRRADAPAELDRLVGELLAPDPADRPADAAEVIRRLVTAMWPGSTGRHAGRPSPVPPVELFLAPNPADPAVAPAPTTAAHTQRPYNDPAVERLAARLDEAARAADPARRVRAARMLLVDLETTLEPDHELVLRAKHRLATWVGEAGDEELAVRMLRELSHTCTRLLGATHPDTLTCRHHEAEWTGRAGWPERAVELLEELEADRRVVVGADDERTLVCRHNLARWTARSGRVGSAVMLLRELTTDCRRALGPDHPVTLAALSEQAHWTGVAGDPVEAAQLCQEVVERRQRVLGPDHPATRSVRRELDRWNAHQPQRP